MKVDYTLYLCTDSGLMSCNTVEESVERAIQGGVSVVQLREKEASSRELFELAKRVKRVTDKYYVPLIINDRLDILPCCRRRRRPPRRPTCHALRRGVFSALRR